MINIEILFVGLLLISTFTGLMTEAIKKILVEYSVTYRANTLAGLVALFLSTMVSICYVIVTKSGFTSEVIVCLIGMVFMSWLCAMVGYDKVVQAIAQFKMDGKGDDNE